VGRELWDSGRALDWPLHENLGSNTGHGVVSMKQKQDLLYEVEHQYYATSKLRLT